MKGEKPNFNFGGNRQHRPLGFGPQQKPLRDQKLPEYFTRNEDVQKEILAELKTTNQLLRQIIEKLGTQGL